MRNQQPPLARERRAHSHRRPAPEADWKGRGRTAPMFLPHPLAPTKRLRVVLCGLIAERHVRLRGDVRVAPVTEDLLGRSWTA